jgi:O-antigen ligase
MIAADRYWPEVWVPLCLGIWSAAIVLAPGGAARLAIALPVLLMAIGWWSILQPGRWLMLFFATALLTPPLPLPGGDSGVHLAPFVALLGFVAAAIRMPDWRSAASRLNAAFGGFLAVLFFSSCIAMLYSGGPIAAGSMTRVLLFSLSVFVFWHAACGPDDPARNPFGLTRFLFFAAVIAALFGCADFYFQFPAPAGFEEQFVWLDEGVVRRAQGLFYEASTFGNFCAFFLVMILVALWRPREHAPVPRFALAIGGIVFSAALILSYSRASLLNIAVACIALALLRRVRIARTALFAGIAVVIAVFVVRTALPSFSASYWSRVAGSLQYFWSSPDGVLSGRVTNWRFLLDFLVREPWHVLFGIGYKTLPYSRFAGAAVIADNTYLSLLVETGVIGLVSFVALNVAMIRGALRAASSSGPRAVFFGEWFLCFWAGETVQMFAGDLITYWRVLPVYFWVLGTAIRQAKRNA